jgi:dTDP-4-dehydrorhamnose reductase
MILVTGANGFIGSYLVARLVKEGYPVLATGTGPCRLPADQWPGLRYESLDITDPFAVHDIFAATKPDIIVHCAAMGKPDECEQKQWAAHQVNVQGTINLALEAAECDAYFLFLSTDFVFDGEAGMYREEDTPHPVNFYGRTKLEAEAAVEELTTHFGIVRTVLVYGAPQTGRSNLLSIVASKLQNGEHYSVVDDQVRTPTYVEDLVDALIAMIRKKAQGMYHICGDEIMTPYQMAKATAEYLNLDASNLKKVLTKNLNHPARRPMRTGLSIDKARKDLAYKPRTFREGLEAMFKQA